jgi:ParB family transcriptional regulator, chromosome partitioning protein
MPPSKPSKKLTNLGDKFEKDFALARPNDAQRVVVIELEKVVPNPEQPRKTFDEEALKELAASIKRHGLIQPITIKKSENSDTEQYILVAGERRFRAHQLLGKAEINAIITKGNPDEIALIENLQREDLKPLEEAEALQRLMERYDYTHETLAEVVGKNRTTVTKVLRLNTLPARIKEECATSHNASKSLLLEIAHLPKEEDQLKLWDEVRSGKVATVRTIRDKKEGNEVRDNQTPTQKLLTSGRSFARRLRKIKIEDLEANRDQLRELLELSEEIEATIAEITASAPKEQS